MEINIQKYQYPQLTRPNIIDFTSIHFGPKGSAVRYFYSVVKFIDLAKAEPELKDHPMVSELLPHFSTTAFMDVLKKHGFEAEVHQDKAEYQKFLIQYQEDITAQEVAFKQELLNDMELNDLPGDVGMGLINEAWAQGHSSGYVNVADIAQDLVSIVMPLIEGYRALKTAAE